MRVGRKNFFSKARPVLWPGATQREIKMKTEQVLNLQQISLLWQDFHVNLAQETHVTMFTVGSSSFRYFLTYLMNLCLSQPRVNEVSKRDRQRVCKFTQCLPNTLFRIVIWRSACTLSNTFQKSKSLEKQSTCECVGVQIFSLNYLV